MKLSAKDFTTSNETLIGDFYCDQEGFTYTYGSGYNLYRQSPGGVEIRLMFYFPGKNTQPHLQLWLNGRMFFDFVDTNEIDHQVDNSALRPLVEKMVEVFISQGRLMAAEREKARLDQEARVRKKILDQL